MSSRKTIPGSAYSLRAIRRLRRAGFQAYWVGGSVRDILLGRRPKDFDIVTGATPRQIARLFPKHAGVGKKFGIIIATEFPRPIEIATFRRDLDYRDGRRPLGIRLSSLEEDVLRRDFTVNGLLMDPLTLEVIDRVGGRRDLERRVIRTIGEPLRRFEEDHLRMLRAIRFSTQLGFKIEPRTWRAIQRSARRIRRISAERMRDELIKIFSSPEPDRGLYLLERSGLLGVILPEVARLKGVRQSRKYHPEGDVFRHTALVLKALRDKEPALIMAALLHDVEKPSTYFKDHRGTHFYGHEIKGVKTAVRIMKRLRFPLKDQDKAAYLIRNHLKWYSAPEMRPTRLRNFMEHPYFPLAVELFRADSVGNPKHKAIQRFIMAQYMSKASKGSEKPLIMGRDLIDMGLKEGPIIGEIIRSVEERRLDEKLKNREDAEKWIKKQYSDHFSA